MRIGWIEAACAVPHGSGLGLTLMSKGSLLLRRYGNMKRGKQENILGSEGFSCLSRTGPTVRNIGANASQIDNKQLPRGKMVVSLSTFIGNAAGRSGGAVATERTVDLVFGDYPPFSNNAAAANGLTADVFYADYPPTPPPSPPAEKKKGLENGAIAGIVVGSMIGMVLIGLDRQAPKGCMCEMKGDSVQARHKPVWRVGVAEEWVKFFF
jgi:hypothetical protein